MRLVRLLLAIASFGFAQNMVCAAEPITVELRDRAAVGSSVVAVGDVAFISGGDANTRAALAQIDLAELKSRESNAVVGRRSVEYRLRLAGFDANSVRVVGAERAVVSLARRVITIEEVTSAAKTELLRHLATENAQIELALPVVVKLPEIPTSEQPVITAKPHGRVVAPGRVQMDMSIACGNVPLLSFAIYLEVKSSAVMPAAGVAGTQPTAGIATTQPAAAQPNAVVIRPRQRVSMEVHTGGLTVKAVGEALQEGRLGQSIQVQNVDSKKTIVAKVTGPSTVEVDIGGPP